MSSQHESSRGLEDHSQLWDATDLTVGNVQLLVNRRDSENSGNNGETTGDYASRHPDKVKTWHRPGNRTAPISLGDGEMTASINGYGRILQFGRYLTVDNGRAGMFVADHASAEGPWKARARVANLQKMSLFFSSLASTSYDLSIQHKIMYRLMPEVGLVHYRWPHIRYSTGNSDITVQSVVRDGTFVQQSTIKNTTSQIESFGLHFLKDFYIREADDYTERSKTSDSCNISLGPFGYSLVATLPLRTAESSDNNADDEENDEDDRGDDDSKSENSSKDNRGDSKNKGDNKVMPTPKPEPGGLVGIVATVFINGKAQKFDASLEGRWQYELPASGTVQITSAYRMLYLPGSPLPWKEFVIPAEMTDLDSFLHNEPFDPNLVLSTIDPAEGRSAQTDQESDQLRDDHTEEAGGGSSDHDGDYNVEPVSEDNSEHGQKNGPLPDPEGIPFRNVAAHIEYATRVKLEQILNVCAISSRLQTKELETTLESEASASVPGPVRDDLKSVAPVVLTCGDISTHRVNTTSSFFAFRFLVEIYKRLLTVPRSEYVEDLEARIYNVCRGHVKWLLELEKTANDTFGPNYNLSGKLMHKTDDMWWLADDSLTDTPFHLLKMIDYVRYFKDKSALDCASIVRSLRKLDRSWKKDLLKREHRKAFAWPDRKDRGVHVFRLDDHMWIWATLEAMSDLDSTLEDMEGVDDAIDGFFSEETTGSGVDRLSPRDVQREMLRRFTTDNDAGTRMLALIRSARETRFLFNARSTSFFYEKNRDFFNASRNLWQNTIDAQRHYDENQVAAWDNAIRYALAIIMSSNDLHMTKSDPEYLLTRSLATLFGSAGNDAFFPGQLDETTKEPVLFYDELDRDFYFHAGFEVSYVLFTEARKIQRTLTKSRHKGWQGGHSGYDGHNIAVANAASETIGKVVLQAPLSDGGHDHGHDKSHPVRNDQMTVRIRPDDLTYTRQRRVTFKKHLPFNNLIDSSSIVEMSEEWIYNYPSFLVWRPTLRSEDVLEQIQQVFTGDADGNTGNVILEASYKYRIQSRRLPKLLRTDTDASTMSISSTVRPETKFEFDNANLVGFVEDTPKGKHTGRRNRDQRDDRRLRKKAESTGNGPKVLGKTRLSTEIGLWNHLNRPRTAEEAKKRLIWLERGSPLVALICHLTSPQDEKLPISLFFDRHATYDMHFFDTTNRVLNTWETEVHLSFYQMLCDGDHPGKEGPGGISGIPQPSIDTYRIGGSKGRTFRLTRAAMGFRFIGDIFDRYWTCHFIQYIPHVAGSDEWRWACATDLKQINLPFDMLPTNRSWRQRKVLELHLFELMLSQLVASTRELLHTIRDELGVRQGAVAISVLNSDDYFSSSIQWQQFQQMLQTVEDEIESVQSNVIDKWLNREKDRGQEQPRWTRNDELKYRGTITNLQAAIGRKLRDLRREKAKVHSLNTWLGHTQDQIRDDLSLRGAENIRFFTYVTVVFLPLGFAASIFSMSDSGPVRSVLVSMVVCAVVALVVTVVALVNAQVLAGLVENISSFISQRGRETMQRSLLLGPRGRYRWARRRAAKKEGRLGDLEEEEGVLGAALAAGSDRLIWDRVATGATAKDILHNHQPRVPSGKPGGRSWHLLFWLAYVSVEMPARCVERAVCALAGRTASPLHAVLHIVVGLLAIPFFIMSWTMQVAVFNVVDVAVCLWNRIRFFLPGGEEDAREYDGTSISRFMYPLESMRPMKATRDKMREQLDMNRLVKELSAFKEKERKRNGVATGPAGEENVGIQDGDNAEDASDNV